MIDKKKILPVLFLFTFVNLFLFFIMYFYQDSLVKIKFLMAVNFMLLMVSLINFIRLLKMQKGNPSAMVRSVMVGTLIKMLFFAGAALIYATNIKVPVGMPTLLSSMSLYLIYTWLEVSWSQIKK
jgi:hypothetical protein